MTNYSQIIRDQFPEFFQERGDTFILLLEEYYKWMESQELVIVDKIEENTTIDTSIDEFKEYFKNTYLKNIKISDNVDFKKILRHSKDLYDSRGTEQGIKLLFSLLIGEDVEVSYPKDYILKPSDGDWVEIEYIESSPNDRNFELVDKLITGSISKATAIVESVIRRYINDREIDVIYISNSNGTFVKDDKIIFDGIIYSDSSIVNGSLTSFELIDGGKNYSVGDTVEILSNFGTGAKARVVSTENGTGKVDFNIEDEGFGYSTLAETTVAERMYRVSNTSNFLIGDSVTQPITTIELLVPPPFYVNEPIISFTSGTNIVQAYARVLSVDNTTVKVYVDSGVIGYGDMIQHYYPTPNNYVMASVPVINNPTAIVTGANSSWIGLHGFTSDFYFSNTYPLGFYKSSNTSVNTTILERATGFGADFNVGTIGDTELILVAPDTFKQLNTSNNVMGDIFIDGKGAGIGFLDKVVVGKSITKKAGSTGFFTIGDRLTISSNTDVFKGYATCYLSNSTHLKIAEHSNTSPIGIDDKISSYDGFTQAQAITTLSGTGYANTNTIVISGGSDTIGIGSISITSGGTGYANGQVLTFSENTSNNALASIVTNGSGAITSINLVKSGKGYRNPSISVANTSGTGAIFSVTMNNPTGGNCSMVTNGTGNVVGATITNIGSNYSSQPKLTVTSGSGSGAELIPLVDYGYGFVKSPNGDGYSYFDSILRKLNMTVGYVASLKDINSGNNYNVNPFTIVNEPYISAMERYNLKLNLTGVVGSFFEGEEILQTLSVPIKSVSYTGVGTFNEGEMVRQGNTTFGIVSYTQSGLIRLKDIEGTFVVTSNTATQITGLSSNITANISSITNSSDTVVSKGYIVAGDTNQITIKRRNVNLSFSPNAVIQGSKSGATGTIASVISDTDSLVLGNNSIISSVVKSANGIVTELELLASAFGYLDNEITTTTSETNNFALRVRNNVNENGFKEGYYNSTKGLISSYNKIYDGYYYQQYSYEIVCSKSLDKYASILKDLMHVAGTRMFGKISINNKDNVTITNKFEIV